MKWKIGLALAGLSCALVVPACSSNVETSDKDGSNRSALAAGCGDGTLDPGEQCDDGNTTNGDGCSERCEFEGEVCVPHDTPGADDDTVTACVCALDAFCCDTSWDATCVSEAVTDCGAVCPTVCGNGLLEAGEECDDGNTADGDGCDSSCKFDGDVCVARDTPGAKDPAVVACVCGAEPFCCDTAWDLTCVGKAITDCGAACTIDKSPCTPHPTPGADDSAIEACVCSLDAYCCDTAWDASCVSTAVNDCGAVCAPVCGNGMLETDEECDDGNTASGDGCDGGCRFEGDVCVARETPGANDPAIVGCVCNADSYCCETAWDETCVTAAVNDCGAHCPPPARVLGGAKKHASMLAPSTLRHGGHQRIVPTPKMLRSGRSTNVSSLDPVVRMSRMNQQIKSGGCQRLKK